MKLPLLFLSVAVFSTCVAFRQVLERDPVTHMLVLLPALAFAGWLMAKALGGHRAAITKPHANALTLLSVFAILFWMLPRYIDASLVDPWTELAKFVSIPLAVGAVLAVSWKAAHPLLRGFLKANALSMLGVLAFLYTHAPVRICNSYLVLDQERLGYGFLFVALALSLAWTVPLFFPPGMRNRSQGQAFTRAAT